MGFWSQGAGCRAIRQPALLPENMQENSLQYGLANQEHFRFYTVQG
jgi:hypothetical protein